MSTKYNYTSLRDCIIGGLVEHKQLQDYKSSISVEFILLDHLQSFISNKFSTFIETTEGDLISNLPELLESLID